ncbi:MAG: gliding motility-associated C-terminal domain-containing protein, partial [Bacteroidales bacterium]|nr:gliding motility-associated C-terminal domain-containing protein [Bacteroidales bacterium]
HQEVSLTNFKTVSIRVIAPPVENLTAEALGNGIELKWDNAPCENAIEYRIYRRNGFYGFEPGYCETGVPAYTGYQLIQRIAAINAIAYRDDNNGTGLVPGVDYCYLITTAFQDGSESLAGNEACASLKRDLPVITHVSNDSLDLLTGRVLTAWSPPTELDTIQYPPPYRYNLIRQLGNETNVVFTGIGLLDTLFTDNSININEITQSLAYAVELENDRDGAIGSSPRADALSLDISPTDEALLLRWNANVPWTNDSFDIYRQTAESIEFEFIKRVYSREYKDDSLTNGSNYCYYIKSYGGYSTSGIIHPIVNFSPIVCAIPIDNIPPCPPILSVETDCETIENTLSWQNPVADSCKNDAVTYLIYFTPMASESFVLIDSVTNPTDSSWVHQNLDVVIGCYYLKARDENGNISAASNIVCVDYDTCPLYELPNVFTPNADLFNDLWIPLNYPTSNPKATVESISLVVFNRWGNTVFETTNPEIEWDGKNQENGKDCADGTYFYVCEVFIKTIDGQVKQTLHGSVSIIR